jgi:hypothetical protein
MKAMRYRFEHDGQPEARDFDENYFVAATRPTLASAPAAPARREWRESKNRDEARKLTDWHRPNHPLLSLSRLMN